MSVTQRGGFVNRQGETGPAGGEAAARLRERASERENNRERVAAALQARDS